ncbi:MAG: hypothetical protein QM679_05895 [Patulibacter sp.]
MGALAARQRDLYAEHEAGDLFDRKARAAGAGARVLDGQAAEVDARRGILWHVDREADAALPTRLDVDAVLAGVDPPAGFAFGLRAVRVDRAAGRAGQPVDAVDDERDRALGAIRHDRRLLQVLAGLRRQLEVRGGLLFTMPLDWADAEGVAAGGCGGRGGGKQQRRCRGPYDGPEAIEIVHVEV